MKVSSRTLRAIAELINGDNPTGLDHQLSPYRTLNEITQLFREFGERDIHPNSGAPSRFSYTLSKLEKFDGLDNFASVVMVGLDFWTDARFDPQQAAAHLNVYLRRDGYEITREDRYLRMRGDEAETLPYLAIRSIRSSVLEVSSLVRLTEESIDEHIGKARSKIRFGDYSGAISNVYTLVEAFLKAMLKKTGTEFNESDGDIRSLYRLLAPKLKLDAKEHIEVHFKAIIDGLQKQVAGIYEVSNKGSDRHHRKYNPAKHHAKLCVNAAFALCEFCWNLMSINGNKIGKMVDEWFESLNYSENSVFCTGDTS